MSWGYLTLGRIPLRETYRVNDQVNASTGERTITLTGTETYPGITYDELVARREDLMGIRGELVGVTFSRKTTFSGFYTVKDLGANIRDYKTPDEAALVDWNATLSLIGPAAAVDLESRLTGIARVNNFAVSGERWHAPAAGALAYWAGVGPSSAVTRALDANGPITVYRGIPAATDPRWSVASPAALLYGRVRFNSASVERYGIRINVPATNWEINNGLVRVRPSQPGTGTLEISAWGGSAWETKEWDVSVGGDIITPAEFLGCTVLRNDIEMVSVRIMANDPLKGRTYVDLALRRGSRFVEGYVQVPASSTLVVQLHSSEASTQTSGYVLANANDGSGNKAWSASAKTFTPAANGGISLAATTKLDWAAGVVLDGTGAVAGDLAADLYAQYIGALPEATAGVLR